MIICYWKLIISYNLYFVQVYLSCVRWKFIILLIAKWLCHPSFRLKCPDGLYLAIRYKSNHHQFDETLSADDSDAEMGCDLGPSTRIWIFLKTDICLPSTCNQCFRSLKSEVFGYVLQTGYFYCICVDGKNGSFWIQWHQRLTSDFIKSACTRMLCMEG